MIIYFGVTSIVNGLGFGILDDTISGFRCIHLWVHHIFIYLLYYFGWEGCIFMVHISWIWYLNILDLTISHLVWSLFWIKITTSPLFLIVQDFV